MMSSSALHGTRVLEWVRCGQDAGIDRLLHAQRIRAAGVLFVRAKDALAWTAHAVPAPVERGMGGAIAPEAPIVLQGATIATITQALSSMRGVRVGRREDSTVSIVQYLTLAAGKSWAGTGGVGAPAQGNAGPLSIRTLIGAARGVALETPTSEAPR
jgi:hypothetical protein